MKLLQGDLAEAWREGGREYATVAMRYSMVDITRERASGKIVDGSETPQEITELWTFMRSARRRLDPLRDPAGVTRSKRNRKMKSPALAPGFLFRAGTCGKPRSAEARPDDKLRVPACHNAHSRGRLR